MSPVWGLTDGSPLDRPNTGGWVVSNKRLAARLATAIRAGVVCLDPEVRRDVTGQTYVSDRHTVMAKYANADLTRLGF